MAKYAVSALMAFTNQAERDDLALKFIDRVDGGLTDPGGFLMIGKTMDGSHMIEANFAFTKKADRDALHAELKAKKEKAIPNKLSKISKHTCGHTDKEPCRDLVSEEWGGE